jgi:diguanylate cyclase (GGDEF)-like protein
VSGETGIRDLQTGLYAREYFDEIIGRELERSRRHNIALSVLSVVVSNRASLIHSAGEEGFDVVIGEAAKTLQINVRETDLVFRWEIDEFLVLLFEADLEVCSHKVQQLANVFRPWRESQGPIPHPVKIRVGAATLEKDIVFAGVLQAARAAARNQTRS